MRRVDTGSLALLGGKKEVLRSASIRRPPPLMMRRRRDGPFGGPDLIRSLDKIEKGLSAMMMMDCSPAKLNMGNSVRHSCHYVKLKLKRIANIRRISLYLSQWTLHLHLSSFRLSLYPLSQENLLSLFGATHGFTGHLGPAKTTTLVVLGTLTPGPLVFTRRPFGKPIVQGWL